MQSFILPKSRRNDVLAAINNLGLNPLEFDWIDAASENTPDATISLLMHTPTSFYFVFDVVRGKPFCIYSPGHDAVMDTEYPGTLSGQVECARRWLKSLKREVDAPDLWAMLAKQNKMAVAVSTDTDNSTFTPDEVERVAQSIDELKQYVRHTMSLNSQQLARIDEQLNYLIDASDRMGRKDWLLLFLGQLTSMALTGSMATQAASDLFRVAGELMGWMISTPLLSIS